MGKFQEQGTKIGKLVEEKNKQYSNAFDKVAVIMRVLYPDGITFEDYEDATVLVRILDKVVRISNGNQGNENAYEDLCGYGILMSAKEKSWEEEQKWG